MKSISVGKARSGFSKLLDQTAKSNNPIRIKSPRNEAVLMSATLYRGIQETLYLYSMPGMRDSILAGLKTPISQSKQKLYVGRKEMRAIRSDKNLIRKMHSGSIAGRKRQGHLLRDAHSKHPNQP